MEAQFRLFKEAVSTRETEADEEDTQYNISVYQLIQGPDLE